MRGRKVGFLILLGVANVGVLASFAMSVLVNLPPAPPPLLVTAAVWPTPLPGQEDEPSPPPPTTAPTLNLSAPVQTATPIPQADALITSAPTEAPPATVEEAAPTSNGGFQPDADVVSLEDLPEKATVVGVVGHRQSLPLSCESRSAVDWAAFFGANINELDFLEQLPASDDPDRGFVGDVRGTWGQTPPNAYGVHAGPVARLLSSLGVPASWGRYLKWSVVQREIAAGRPVITWVVGHAEPGHSAQIYTAADGRETVVAAFEHTVIVVGYSADTVTIVDGAQLYTRPLEDFLASWGVLRNMAITYNGS